MLHDLILGGEWILVVAVLAAAVPELAAAWQFLLAACHYFRNHYDSCRPVFPRTAVLIPAWNEGAVIGESIDRLTKAEYPRESLRIYVVDDASTDETPQRAPAQPVSEPETPIDTPRSAAGT